MNGKIDGVQVFDYFRMGDERGTFEKPIADLSSNFPSFNGVVEFFTSTSAANVWRGFHLQTAPNASNRIIYCSAGIADDYLIDLRHKSGTFKVLQRVRFDHTRLARAIFVPAGVAHGFLSKVDGTTIVYLSDRKYAISCDTGVHYKSIIEPYKVPGISNPMLSTRDELLPSLNDFIEENHQYE